MVLFFDLHIVHLFGMEDSIYIYNPKPSAIYGVGYIHNVIII